jgi:hypothetical protein
MRRRAIIVGEGCSIPVAAAVQEEQHELRGGEASGRQYAPGRSVDRRILQGVRVRIAAEIRVYGN